MTCWVKQSIASMVYSQYLHTLPESWLQLELVRKVPGCKHIPQKTKPQMLHQQKW